MPKTVDVDTWIAEHLMQLDDELGDNPSPADIDAAGDRLQSLRRHEELPEEVFAPLELFLEEKRSRLKAG